MRSKKLCVFCKRNWTHTKYLCYGCEGSKKHQPEDFDNSIRAYEADRAHSTPKSMSAYGDAVYALARSLPVSAKQKSEFVKAMKEADKTKGRGKDNL